MKEYEKALKCLYLEVPASIADDVKSKVESEIQRLKDKAVEAIGWAYADCCSALDKGKDPRETKMPDVLERAKKDLNL